MSQVILKRLKIVSVISVLMLVVGAGVAPFASAQDDGGTLQPRVECVLALGNGFYVAYFGYDNPTGRDVLLMRGDDNLLNLDVADDYQPPQRFNRAGSDPFPDAAFAVPFNTAEVDSVSWTLAGTTVTASGESPACSLEPMYEVRVDPNTVTHTVDGFGGAFVHYFSKTPTRDAYDAVARENLAALRPTHVRVGIPLFMWEPANDDGDPATYNWAAFNDSDLVQDVFTFMADLDEDVTILASLWRPPEWVVENPESTRRLIVTRGMQDELIESLVAWLVYARDEYGVIVDYVSINEPNIGVNMLLEDPADYADFVRRSGERFVQEGLPTLWAMGDTSNGANAVSYSTPIWEDNAARPYIGVLAFHSWDASLGDASMERIAEWAEDLGLPVWVTETGFDSAAHETPEVFETWDYALDLALIYNRLYKSARPQVAFYWQMMDDYRLVSPDGAQRFPSFFVLRQLRDYVPPGAEVVRTSANGIREYVFAAQSDAGFTVHVVNTDVFPRVIDVTGVPDGTYRYVRLSAHELSEVELEPVEAADGVLRVAVPGRSVNVLTTISPVE